ncbi:MAG: PEGA domain-containing protein [Kiritimatiellae bacterium]|nr:PEGA domain-containing protein [Kiritimatiellia bacterium]
MRAFPLMLALASFAAAFAAPQPPARLDVTARPETTRVVVDGESRGTVANGVLNVFDLKPGRHLLHLEAPGCRCVDEFFTIGESEFLRKDFELTRETGLLLVKSDPAGSEVQQNGTSIGSTPLLLTTLPTDETHSFEICRPGYQTKRIDVALDGRTPVVREEKLTLDSGVLTVSSEPSGAEVLVNGISRGRTPMTLENVPKGNVSLELRLDGYNSEKRDLRVVPGMTDTLAFKLRGLPSTIKVVSTPENARVLLDDDYKGKTPLEIKDVSSGLHTLRLELPGYATQARSLTLSNGSSSTEEFVFESILGRIEVVTTPPGAKIMLDGKPVGTTLTKTITANKSDTFTIDKVEAGEHTVVANLYGHREASRKVVVEAKKSASVVFKLKRVFTPDTIVVTQGGTYSGVLVTATPDLIRLEVKEGVTRDFRRDGIREVKPIEQP